MKFLACLDPDPTRAGEKYEELRESLLKFLDWRGAPFPDELVDEIFNRVTRKLEERGSIDDLPTYCHGVARLVFLQSLEHPGNKRVELEELSRIAIPEPDVADMRLECLAHCLRRLPAEDRELIIEYYRKDGRRKIDHRIAMAERLGIPLNALWSRAQRIRKKLVDSYLRGEMSRADRERFEAHYLASSLHRERVAIAKAFLTNIDQAPVETVEVSEKESGIPWRRGFLNFLSSPRRVFGVVVVMTLLLTFSAGRSYIERARLTGWIADVQ